MPIQAVTTTSSSEFINVYFIKRNFFLVHEQSTKRWRGLRHTSICRRAVGL